MRNWFKQLLSRRRYNELSDSIREHLDEKVADLMDQGMTREHAEQAARREFGNVTRIEERGREVWQWSICSASGDESFCISAFSPQTVARLVESALWGG